MTPSAAAPVDAGLEAERRWLAEVYRPNERQLTLRAILMGMVVGMAMCLSNLYVVLKTGWSLGVTMTACIVAFAMFRLLKVLRLSKGEFTPLENNAMGSVASAAGYMTGGGNMAAIPALFMLTGTRPEAAWLMLWFAAISALGVVAAIPIKRQLINREQLAFPTGTATAETIRILHSHGEEGVQKARWLGLSALVGGVLAWLREGKAAWMPFKVPDVFGLPFRLGGRPALDWTLGIEGSVLMLGAGGLMSLRTGWSLLLGALMVYGLLAPTLHEEGAIASVSYKGIAAWAVWPGASILVSSGLTTFALQWRSVARAFSGLAGLVGKKGASEASSEVDPLEAVECPQSWFAWGFLAFGPVVVFLCYVLFDVPLWAAVLALPLALVMGVVAARATGETDVTPTKALGPMTQLFYGAALPGQLVPNLMMANVTGGVGLHAADLLTDLKSGYLLGAKPRQQFFAQLFGVAAGTLAVVPAFNLLVPTPDVLGSATFPAPSVQVWAGVSKMLVSGLASIPPSARWAALVGLVVGTVLALLEAKGPKRLKPFIPSPSGLGIAFVIPGYNAIMMFLGTLGAELLRRKLGPKQGDELSVPVASGFIAGESLVGIGIKMAAALAR